MLYTLIHGKKKGLQVYFSKAKTTQPQAKPDYRAHL